MSFNGIKLSVTLEDAISGTIESVRGNLKILQDQTNANMASWAGVHTAQQTAQQSLIALSAAELQADSSAARQANTLQTVKNAIKDVSDSTGQLRTLNDQLSQSTENLITARENEVRAVQALKLALADQLSTEEQVVQLTNDVTQARTQSVQALQEQTTASNNYKTTLASMQVAEAQSQASAAAMAEETGGLSAVFEGVVSAGGKVVSFLGNVKDALGTAKDAVVGFAQEALKLTGDAFSGLGTIGNGFKDLVEGAGNAAQQVLTLGGALTELEKYVSIGGLIAAGFALVEGAVNAAKEALSSLKDDIVTINGSLEQSALRFEAFTGSVAASREILTQLQTVAKDSIFGLPQLSQGAAQLLNFNVSAKNTVPLLNAIQVAAAAAGDTTGASFESITRTLGELAGGMQLSERQVRQLITAGVPLQPLADQLGITVEQLNNVGKTGIVTGAQLVQAFYEVYTNGKLGDFMTKEGSTFNGALNIIKTNLQLAVADTFSPFFELIKEGAVTVADFLRSDQFQEFQAVAKGAITEVVSALQSLATELAPIGDLFKKAFEFGGDPIQMFSKLQDAFDQTFSIIYNKINAFTGGMLDAGRTLIQTFAGGIVSGAEEFITAAIQAVGDLIASFFVGNSPPPAGPLSTIDKAGQNLMMTYGAGMLAGTDNISKAAQGASDSLTNLDSTMNLPTGKEALRQAKLAIDGMKQSVIDLNAELLNTQGQIVANNEALIPIKINMEEITQTADAKIAPLQQQLDSMKLPTDYNNQKQQMQDDITIIDAKAQEQQNQPQIDADKAKANADKETITQIERTTNPYTATIDKLRGQLQDVGKDADDLVNNNLHKLQDQLADVGRGDTDTINANITNLKDQLQQINTGTADAVDASITQLKDQYDRIGQNATDLVDNAITNLKNQIEDIRNDPQIDLLQNAVDAAKNHSDQLKDSKGTTDLKDRIDQLNLKKAEDGASGHVDLSVDKQLSVLQAQLKLSEDNDTRIKNSAAEQTRLAEVALSQAKQADQDKIDALNQQVQLQQDVKSQIEEGIKADKAAMKDKIDALTDQSNSIKAGIKAQQDAIQDQISAQTILKDQIDEQDAVKREGFQREIQHENDVKFIQDERTKTAKESLQAQINTQDDLSKKWQSNKTISEQLFKDDETYWNNAAANVNKTLEATIKNAELDKSRLGDVIKRADLENQIAELPIKQKIEGIKNEEEAALAPLKARVAEYDNANKLLDLQKQKLDLIKSADDLRIQQSNLNLTTAKDEQSGKQDKTSPPLPNLGDLKVKAPLFDKDAMAAEGKQLAINFAEGAKKWIEDNFGSVVGGAIGGAIGNIVAGPIGGIIGSILGKDFGQQIQKTKDEFGSLGHVAKDFFDILTGKIPESSDMFGWLMHGQAGPFEEAGAKIASFLKDDLIPGIKDFFDALTGKEHEGPIDTVQQKFQDFGKAIHDAFVTVKDAVGEFFEGLKGHDDSTKSLTTISDITNGIGLFIRNDLIPGIKDLFDGLTGHSDAQTQLDGFRTVMSDIGKFVNEAIKAVGDFFYGLTHPEAKPSKDMDDVQTSAMNLGQFIVNQLIPTVKEIWRIFQDNVLPVLKDIVRAIRDDVLPQIKEWTRAFKEDWLPVLKDLSEIFGPAVKAILFVIGATFATMGGTITAAWNEVIKPAFKEFDEGWQGLKNSFNTVWNEGLKPTIQAIKDFFHDRLDESEKAFASLEKTAGETWDHIKSAISSKEADLSAALHHPWDTIKKDIETIWSDLKKDASGTWLGDIMDALETWFKQNEQKLKNIFMPIRDALMEPFKVAFDSVKLFIDAFKKLINFISGTFKAPDIVGNVPDVTWQYKAMGGRVDSDFQVVGEKGAEIVQLPRGSWVNTHDESRQMFRSWTEAFKDSHNGREPEGAPVASMDNNGKLLTGLGAGPSTSTPTASFNPFDSIKSFVEGAASTASSWISKGPSALVDEAIKQVPGFSAELPGAFKGIGEGLVSETKDLIVKGISSLFGGITTGITGSSDLIAAIKAATSDVYEQMAMLFGVGIENGGNLTGPWGSNLAGSGAEGPFQLMIGPGGSYAGTSKADADNPFTAALKIEHDYSSAMHLMNKNNFAKDPEGELLKVVLGAERPGEYPADLVARGWAAVLPLLNLSGGGINGGTNSTAPGANPSWPSDLILHRMLSVPGAYGFCETFVQDVMNAVGAHYKNGVYSAKVHSGMQPLNHGWGPPGAIQYWDWVDPADGVNKGHVGFDVDGRGLIYGTVGSGTGYTDYSGWPSIGWTENPALDGRTITEPVVGRGLRSGQSYSIAEDGLAEQVLSNAQTRNLATLAKAASGLGPAMTGGQGGGEGAGDTHNFNLHNSVIVDMSGLGDLIHKALLLKKLRTGPLGL